VGVLPSGAAHILGIVIAGAIVISLASTGGTWIMAADRTYAIASLDRTAPAIFGRFSARFGTPIFVNLMSGTVASLTMIFAVIAAQFFGSENLNSLFLLVLGFSISTSTLSYLFMFPAFLILRYKFPNVRRPYKVPGGKLGAWLVMLSPLLYVSVASFFLIYPAQSAVDNASVSRATYELTQLAPFSVIIVLTIVFYIIGQRQKTNKDVVVDLNTATGAEVPASALAEE
jgi:glutamate:GABA antiporter